jgi:hypothetical protein
MEPTTFGFSKFVAWSGTIFFVAMLVFLPDMGVSYLPDAKDWLYLGVPILLVLVALFSFVR